MSWGALKQEVLEEFVERSHTEAPWYEGLQLVAPRAKQTREDWRLQDKQKRRKFRLVHGIVAHPCPVCAAGVPVRLRGQGRQRKFCSEKCRGKDRRLREAK